MKVVDQLHVIMHPNLFDPNISRTMSKRIELAGRTCYKSEKKITLDSSEKFIKMIIEAGHESVLEHESVQVKFMTNRGVTHELVRHRIGVAFSQESTRYCDYGDGHVTFIRPVWCGDKVLGDWTSLRDDNRIKDIPLPDYAWLGSCMKSEEQYKILREAGWRPQQAREVLINSLRTEIVVTANIREWRHILRLRCSTKAHPQMRALMLPVLEDFTHNLRDFFLDLYQEVMYVGQA